MYVYLLCSQSQPETPLSPTWYLLGPPYGGHEFAVVELRQAGHEVPFRLRLAVLLLLHGRRRTRLARQQRLGLAAGQSCEQFVLCAAEK